MNSSIKNHTRIHDLFGAFEVFGLDLWIYGSRIHCVMNMKLCLISNEKLYFINLCFIYDSLMDNIFFSFFLLRYLIYNPLKGDFIHYIQLASLKIWLFFFSLSLFRIFFLIIFSRRPSVSSQFNITFSYSPPNQQNELFLTELNPSILTTRYISSRIIAICHNFT